MKTKIRSGDITGFDDAEVIDYEEEKNDKQQDLRHSEMGSNRVPSGIEYVHLGNK